AAWGLAGAGVVGSDVVEALTARLSDPSEAVREGATWSLSHLRGPALRGVKLLDAWPAPLSQPPPAYPEGARHREIHGTVMVALLVNARGNVSHAEIRESIPVLDASALAATRGWLFRPATLHGQPVASVVIAPVTFRPVSRRV